MTPQRSRSAASLREAAAPAWPDDDDASQVYCFAATAPARTPAAAPVV